MAGNCAPCEPYNIVGHQSWAVIGMPVMRVAISASAITVVEIDTVQSAKATNGKNGYIGPPKRTREADLLPVPYFHVVFTLPSELNQLAVYHPKTVYDALFKAAWQTLETFGMNRACIWA